MPNCWGHLNEVGTLEALLNVPFLRCFCLVTVPSSYNEKQILVCPDKIRLVRHCKSHAKADESPNNSKQRDLRTWLGTSRPYRKETPPPAKQTPMTIIEPCLPSKVSVHRTGTLTTVRQQECHILLVFDHVHCHEITTCRQTVRSQVFESPASSRYWFCGARRFFSRLGEVNVELVPISRVNRVISLVTVWPNLRHAFFWRNGWLTTRGCLHF